MKMLSRPSANSNSS